MDKCLPKDIIYRRKMGFPVPINLWLRDGLSDVLNGLITDKNSVTEKLLNRDKIRDMMKIHKTKTNNYSGHLWNLFILELWNKVFIQKQDVENVQLI